MCGLTVIQIEKLINITGIKFEVPYNLFVKFFYISNGNHKKRPKTSNLFVKKRSLVCILTIIVFVNSLDSLIKPYIFIYFGFICHN